MRIILWSYEKCVAHMGLPGSGSGGSKVASYGISMASVFGTVVMFLGLCFIVGYVGP